MQLLSARRWHHLLKDCDFLVKKDWGGKEATEVLEALPHVALLLSDLRMPGKVDGIALA
jgi:CheY-like chemotaxis protein